MPIELLTFEKAVLSDVSRLHPKNSYMNIPKREKQALQQLSTDPDIVIKQADKGGAIVIMDTVEYRHASRKPLPVTPIGVPLYQPRQNVESTFYTDTSRRDLCPEPDLSLLEAGDKIFVLELFTFFPIIRVLPVMLRVIRFIISIG
ncbi:hypothetical protein NDU88_006912 [Pleurodeles waltl]|uniref:Uncharacterized protein n=1 Tax=Pleurodeles waltl TaxID=8319 RepID=A0AAV7PL04_PLEWA|nr:hypothetical protein NDU88_006912 [Pleurodeles waltl]